MQIVIDDNTLISGDTLDDNNLLQKIRYLKRCCAHVTLAVVTMCLGDVLLGVLLMMSMEPLGSIEDGLEEPKKPMLISMEASLKPLFTIYKPLFPLMEPW